ncbi:MAG: inositol 2-dehydrogenase [Gammaproteobacteria bacterium]|nr:MAG: inositol 2-dehydrogenase [Gammaproteobacteria bacterium]
MKPCRIGIIGAGRIGKLHAENIYYRLSQFMLAGIADPCVDREWAQSLSIPLITTQHEELIHHPAIDAILIASPSAFHTNQIIAASQANKAVFCEKPLGLTEEAIQACLTVVEQQQTLLQIGFNRRFDPNFASIHRRVQLGEIGHPHLVHITSRDPTWPSMDYIKTSGGIFMDMTIHDFDMARFLIGSDVVEVFASGSVLIHPDFAECNDSDTAVIQLRFKNGALGVIDNSRQAVYGYDQRVEVFGHQGYLLAKNQTQHAVHYFGRHETRYANPLYFFLERYQEAYLAELESFYQAWLHHQPSPVTGNDGLQALRIAMAAKQSLQTGKAICL